MIHYFYDTLQVGIGQSLCVRLNMYLVNVISLCRVQTYLVPGANRGLRPSTHLIVSAAEGSKYTAAKKWKLPAVSKLYVCL